LLQIGQLHVQFRVHGQQRPAARQHHLAGVGQGKALAGALEQHQVQRLLQLGDHLADRGLGHVQLLGSAAETLVVHDCDEIPQGTQIHDLFQYRMIFIILIHFIF